MQTETIPIASRPQNVRARSTNDPRWLRGIDGRTEIARRRRDLIEALVAALGGKPSDVAMLDVRRAAELTAIAEEARRQALQGAAVDLAALARIEGTADRAVRRLGIKPGVVEHVPLRDRIARATP
jgi:hypothetical protein